MNCKKARELILTDHLDKEAGEKMRSDIKEHLNGCPECSKIAASAVEMNNEFLNTPQATTPPEYVWRRIRDAVVSEKIGSIRPVFWDWDRIRNAFPISRPAYAIVTVITFIMIVGLVAGVYMNKKYVEVESSRYIGYMEEALTVGLSNGESGFGTVVEESFL